MTTFHNRHEDANESGEGYANLTDGNSYKGRIAVYSNWVAVQNSNGRYTIPRRKIDFINWKDVVDE